MTLIALLSQGLALLAEHALDVYIASGSVLALYALKHLDEETWTDRWYGLKKAVALTAITALTGLMLRDGGGYPWYVLIPAGYALWALPKILPCWQLPTAIFGLGTMLGMATNLQKLLGH